MEQDINLPSLEELYGEINIQLLIDKLESGEKLENTLKTLSSMIYHVGRKDALYVLIGYYTLEVKEFEDKEFFFESIHRNCNFELYKMVMLDFTAYKNFYRKKDLVNRTFFLLNMLSMSEEEKEELEIIFHDAVWGKKMKDKFIDKLREIEDLESEKERCLFG